MRTIKIELGELTASEAVICFTGTWNAFIHTAGHILNTEGSGKLAEIEQTVLDELGSTFKAEGPYIGKPKQEVASMVRLAFDTVRQAYKKPTD